MTMGLLLVVTSVGYGVYRKTSTSVRRKPFVLQSIFTSKGAALQQDYNLLSRSFYHLWLCHYSSSSIA